MNTWRQSGDWLPVGVFVATAGGLASLTSLVVGITGGHDSRFASLGVATMFIPAIAVMVTKSQFAVYPVVRREMSVRYGLVALLVVPVVMHLAMLPTMAAVEGLHWDEWLTPDRNGLFHAPVSKGWGDLTFGALIARVLLNAVVGVVVVSVFAFFEEVGWRAWLLPQLKVHMSATGAVVLTSAIWALWHVPFALSGIQHIDGVSPGTLAALLPFGIFSSGLVLGWLWLKTESVWLVAVAHGAQNNWGQYAFKFMEDRPATDGDLMALSAGYLALLGVGTLLLRTRD